MEAAFGQGFCAAYACAGQSRGRFRHGHGRLPRPEAAQRAQPDAAGISNVAIAPIDPAQVPADSKPAIAPIGSSDEISAAVRPLESVCSSNAELWRDFILAKGEQGLSARRIHQDFQAERGAAEVSYDNVRRLLRRAGVTTEVNKPIEYKDGEKLSRPYRVTTVRSSSSYYTW